MKRFKIQSYKIALYTREREKSLLAIFYMKER